MTFYYSKEENCFYSDEQIKDMPEGCIEYTEEEYDDLWNCDEFHYVDQDPETKLPKQFKVDNEEELKLLRKKREQECFPYINRGQLWYNHLTSEQQQELNSWYESWLDVTETKIIPELPSWLK